MGDKKSLLYYGDSPSIGTGFGNVARHVLSRVADRYNITVFGVNEFFNKPNAFPYQIVPATPNKKNDPFGRQKFIAWALQYGKNFDVWWLQNDIHFWPFLPDLVYMVRSMGKNPHIFTYTVVDSPVSRLDIYNLSAADVCGIPSQYGIDEILRTDSNIKYKLRHVPHGIDTSEFYPLPEDQIKAIRADKFKVDDSHFLLVNVNRNSTRKDIPRTLQFYRELKKRVPQARLYLHMQENEENYRGMDIGRILKCNEDTMMGVATPQDFSADNGVPIEVLNMIYNCADAVVSTTLGEGFGLSTIEAMAAKSLVIMPDNTSLSELIKDGRGIPVRCGATVNDWVILKYDLGWERPLTDIMDMTQKTIKVIKNYPDDMVERAYQWVTTALPWDKVKDLFVNGFENKCPGVGTEGGLIV